MLKVKVLLTAHFKDWARVKEVVEELPEGSTIEDLAFKLSSRYGGPFKEVLDRSRFNLDFMFIVNNSIVRDVGFKLNDGDLVVLTIPIVGG